MDGSRINRGSYLDVIVALLSPLDVHLSGDLHGANRLAREYLDSCHCEVVAGCGCG